MTKEEAIKILQNPPRVYNEKMWEALDMAIKALQDLTGGYLISRADAIEAFADMREGYPAVHHEDMLSVAKVVAILQDLPSPEQKTEEPAGEWIKATGMMPPEFHGHHCCSECGNFANMEPPFGNREDLSKFCPSCGVKMRNGYGGNNDRDKSRAESTDNGRYIKIK